MTKHIKKTNNHWNIVNIWLKWPAKDVIILPRDVKINWLQDMNYLHCMVW